VDRREETELKRAGLMCVNPALESYVIGIIILLLERLLQLLLLVQPLALQP
jgi:hypothetical protein